MEKLTEINFFICSTLKDLKNYREELIKAIKAKAGQINSQEFFGSRNSKPIDTCFDEIDQSDVFIMMVGFRLGTIETSHRKSFSELEFERAKIKKKLLFIYFLDENHPFPPKYIDKGKLASKLERFKKKLRKNYTINTFTTTSDLSEKVITDLFRELPKKGFKIKKDDETKEIKTIPILIRNFLTLPKTFYNREFTLKIKLGDFESASENECSAFSYTVGATIKREFEPYKQELFNTFLNLRFIYASNSEAEKLINYKKNSIIEVRLKTIFGTYSVKEPIYTILEPWTSPYKLGFGEGMIRQGKETILIGFDYQEILIKGVGLLDIVS